MSPERIDALHKEHRPFVPVDFSHLDAIHERMLEHVEDAYVLWQKERAAKRLSLIGTRVQFFAELLPLMQLYDTHLTDSASS